MVNAELTRYLKNFLKDKYKSFIDAGCETKAIRLNSLKTKSQYFKDWLKAKTIAFEEIPFNINGFKIPDDSLPLSHTLNFFKGYFQYQGISSQIPALVLNPQPGETVLDMAAAPGSKSTQLAALMKNKGQLILNDAVRHRLQPLNANAQKAGLINQIISYLPAERFGNLFPNYFDKILLDAPCTALGTISSNPEIASWWSEEKLRKLTAVQHGLLVSACKSLKTGGELVYSTCSIAPEENEMAVQKIIDKYNMEILPVPDMRGIQFLPGMAAYQDKKFHAKMHEAVRTAPHIHGLEGFFVCRLRKTGGHKLQPHLPSADFFQTTGPSDKFIADDLALIADYWGIEKNFFDDFRFIKTKNRIWLANNEITEIPENGFTNAGLLFAERKSHSWKLFNQSVQLLGNGVKNRIIKFNEEMLTEIFAGGRIKNPGYKGGYYILEWQGAPLASLYADKDTMRMRLPHYFKLVI